MNKSMVLNTVLSAVGGAIVGGAITYLTVKKHYLEYADTEIENVRRHYALLRKDDNTVTIFGDMPEEDSLAEQFPKAAALVRELGYDPSGAINDEEVETETEPEEEPMVIPTRTSRSIYDQAASEDEVGPELTGPGGAPKAPKVKTASAPKKDPMEDYERISGEPFIIDELEFNEGEPEWDKESLTYFAGDDTLVDDKNMPVDNVNMYVGERHLDMFGVLSNNNKLVYVRNAQISTDFEILKDNGRYSTAVAGPDLDEDETPPLRRMRASD